jgi:hypothetical protein
MIDSCTTDTDRIRDLNDAFRRNLVGGRLVLTAGVAGRSDSNVILAKVCAFEKFDSDNDPHGEHDFGAFDQGNDTIFWKIDYYDADLSHGSENPADPSVTTRVLTVMLAEEY